MGVNVEQSTLTIVVHKRKNRYAADDKIIVSTLTLEHAPAELITYVLRLKWAILEVKHEIILNKDYSKIEVFFDEPLQFNHVSKMEGKITAAWIAFDSFYQTFLEARFLEDNDGKIYSEAVSLLMSMSLVPVASPSKGIGRSAFIEGPFTTYGLN